MARATLLSLIVFGVAALLAAPGSTSNTPLPRRAQTIPAPGELGGPLPGLTPAEMDRWLVGRALFDRDFHEADGLGAPDFNADSCRACHRDPVMGGAGGLELNVSRFGRDFGGAGPFTNLPGGPVLQKLRAPWVGGREELPPEADVFEQRQTQSLLGLGLVERVLDSAILANEDPTDTDGDGVYGVARRIDQGSIVNEIGRFGWKAQIPNLVDFTKDAAHIESGITTPTDGRLFALGSDGDAASDPELSAQQVDDLAFFVRNLAPPARTGSPDPGVLNGETLFADVGCAVCHVPSLELDTGEDAFLYSNLLLHDVMAAGYRGMEEPGAPAGMFRTPPLWGVRHTAPYLHDGRAETLRDAILAHDGEAAATRQRFLDLTAAEQDDLILFLEDL